MLNPSFTHLICIGTMCKSSGSMSLVVLGAHQVNNNGSLVMQDQSRLMNYGKVSRS